MTGVRGGAGGPAERAHPPRAGDPTIIGAYKILGRLAGDDHMPLYLGQAADGRRVAVRTLCPELAASAAARGRFERATATLRGLDDEHVSAVVDASPGLPESPGSSGSSESGGAGAQASPPYLAAAFVDGPTLAEAVATGGALTGPELAAVARATLAATAAFHRIGIMHGGLAPDVVVLTDSGPVLVDLWVHRAVRALLGESGRASGGDGEHAPDRVAGPAAGPSVAADVGDWGRLVRHAAGARTASPDELGRRLGPALAAAVLAAEADPARRPSPADLLATLPVAAPPEAAPPEVIPPEAAPPEAAPPEAAPDPEPALAAQPAAAPTPADSQDLDGWFDEPGFAAALAGYPGGDEDADGPPGSGGRGQGADDFGLFGRDDFAPDSLAPNSLGPGPGSLGPADDRPILLSGSAPAGDDPAGRPRSGAGGAAGAGKPGTRGNPGRGGGRLRPRLPRGSRRVAVVVAAVLIAGAVAASASTLPGHGGGSAPSALAPPAAPSPAASGGPAASGAADLTGASAPATATVRATTQAPAATAGGPASAPPAAQLAPARPAAATPATHRRTHDPSQPAPRPNPPAATPPPPPPSPPPPPRATPAPPTTSTTPPVDQGPPPDINAGQTPPSPTPSGTLSGQQIPVFELTTASHR